MRRLAVARLLQETRSFAPGSVVAPSAVGAGEMAGFRAAGELLGEEVEWLALLDRAEPPGPELAEQALRGIVADLTERLAATTVDGVLLSLHGAMAATDIPDGTGYLLCRVREALGPQVPLVVTLDIHANVTLPMIEAADVLLGPHTFPTTDHESLGRRAAQAMADLLRVGARPQISAAKLPLITTDEGRETADGALAHVWEHFPTAEGLPGMLSVGLFMASPWLDAPQLGWVFYQACYCDAPVLDERAVTRACWASRATGHPEGLRELPYQRVSRPLYPLDDLEEMPLAPWAGDMIHRCHCSQASPGDDAEAGCGGCGKCCGRQQREGPEGGQG